MYNLYCFHPVAVLRRSALPATSYEGRSHISSSDPDLNSFIFVDGKSPTSWLRNHILPELSHFLEIYLTHFFIFPDAFGIVTPQSQGQGQKDLAIHLKLTSCLC